MTHRLGRILSRMTLVLALICSFRVAEAHPHVFVDGGVSFVLDDEGALTSLEVTWQYDLFETLYSLSSLEIVPQPDGSLTEEDRQRLSEHMTDWPDAFKGSAHLSIDGDAQAVSRPTSMQVELVKGSLHLRFTRHLDQSVPMEGQSAEVGFYEETYFYAFSATETPTVRGAGADACVASVAPARSDAQLDALQVTLFDLDREETPDFPNVGALFADRIVLQCE